MKKASIVSIGNELLNGQTVDTNTTYFSGELLAIGIPVASSFTVIDEQDAIVRALKLASEDADIVVATGGLGPTDDDVTREAFAKFLGVELQMKDELLRKIQDFFACRNLKMPDKNRIQAYIPNGADPLPNERGTAAGIIARDRGKLFVALPGVPSEAKEMFAVSVLPHLLVEKGEQAVVVRKLNCYGAGESTIAELVGDMMQRGRNPLINCTVSCGVITLHIVATAENEDQARRMGDQDEKHLRNILGSLIFGTEGQTLSDVIGRELARKGKTVALAESCTGGLVAKLLTDTPGASRYFTHGWVTYANEAKIGELGVGREMIERYGAVSEEVARAMARGARGKALADYAIGITGIAGPTGGNEQKDTGLVYICVDSDTESKVNRYQLSGERSVVRLRAAQTALNMLRLQLFS